MAKKALINKANRIDKAIANDSVRIAAGKEPKAFSSRAYTRCQRCGRPRAVFRKFGLCRICFRTMAHSGEIPGVTKASW